MAPAIPAIMATVGGALGGSAATNILPAIIYGALGSAAGHAAGQAITRKGEVDIKPAAIAGGMGGVGAGAGKFFSGAQFAGAKPSVGMQTVGSNLSTAAGQLDQPGVSGVSSLKSIGSQAAQNASPYGQIASGAGGGIGGSLAGSLSSSLGGGGELTPGVPSTTTPSAVPGGWGEIAGQTISKATKTLGTSLLGANPYQTMAGLGLMGGSSMIKPAEVPKLGAIAQKYVGAGSTPVTQMGQLAQGSLTDILKAAPEDLYPTAGDAYFENTFKQIDKNYDDAIENITNKAAGEGWLNSGEFNDLVGRMEEERAAQKSGFQQEESQRRFELARNYKYNALKEALGIDDEYMKILLSADMEEAMAIFNAEQEDIESIRQAMGTMGGMLAGAGLGVA